MIYLFQFVTPTSRGIPTSNIRFQHAIKMISGNENPPTIALSQIIPQRRLQTVSVQKPPQSVQQQMTIDGSVSPGPSQQQVQVQTSPNTSQQTVTQPQNSPQQV
jgi:hypothetical protein